VGAIEGPHRQRKGPLEQMLIQWGSSDFFAEEEYRQLVELVQAGFNEWPSVKKILSIERLDLRSFPMVRFGNY